MWEHRAHIGERILWSAWGKHSSLIRHSSRDCIQLCLVIIGRMLRAVSATLCANTFPALWRSDLKTAPELYAPSSSGELAVVQRGRPRRLRKILNPPWPELRTICLQYATRIGIIFGNRWHAIRRASFPSWYKSSRASNPEKKCIQDVISEEYISRDIHSTSRNRIADVWKEQSTSLPRVRDGDARDAYIYIQFNYLGINNCSFAPFAS